MSKQIKHILVIRLSAMGDVAMTVPVLRAFTEQNPNVKVTILTRPFFKPFFDDLKNTSVFTAHFNAEHKGINGLYRLSKQLKKIRFDAVADLHNVLRTRVLQLFLVGKPFVQIDKGRAEKKALIQGRIFKQLKTTHERYADVFRKLGFKVDLSSSDFPEKPELGNSTTSLIKGLKGPLLGIAPFAQYQSKEYPLELMEKVIAKLSNSGKYGVLLFGGGKQEIKILDGIEVQYDNVINVAGKLPFKEELNLINHLNVMLSMDSGNGHLAAMYGVPVITLWGVTHPFAGFSPFNQDKGNMLLSDRDKFPRIPTSIYGNKYPKGYEKAMETIDYKSVIEKLETVIDKHQPK